MLRNRSVCFGCFDIGSKHRNKPKYFVFGFTKKTETNAKQILFRFVSVQTEIYFCLFRGHHTTQLQAKLMYVKLPMYLFYMELILNDFEGGKSITRAIGRGGPWKSRLFWHIAISGHKTVSISSAHPFQRPSKWILPPQNHLRMIPRHINNRYINCKFVMKHTEPYVVCKQ